jgi:FKBP-type peptidyl-prolyl cis-trans isomerase
MKNFATLIFMGTFLFCAMGCTKKENQGQPSSQSQTVNPTGSANKSSGITELKIEEITPGTGAEATPGKTVKVHYTGWLANGTEKGNEFDSSKKHGEPCSFPLGAGKVISGWDKGVAGMKVGGKRKLIIPPQMAYGESGAGNVIPPNSTLIFEVELLDVK